MSSVALRTQPRLGAPPRVQGDGQARVNNYHHPERYLIPYENATEDAGDDDEGEKP